MKLSKGMRRFLQALVTLGTADTEEIAYESELTRGTVIEHARYLYGKKLISFCGKGKRGRHCYNITTAGRIAIGADYEDVPIETTPYGG